MLSAEERNRRGRAAFMDISPRKRLRPDGRSAPQGQRQEAPGSPDAGLGRERQNQILLGRLDGRLLAER